MIDIHARLHQLIQSRGWTTYRLALNCGLSHATIANIYRRNTVPSVTTLETICQAFGITLAQFFAEGELVEVTPELREVFVRWADLTPRQKSLTLELLQVLDEE